jgi:hypothetical protein
MSIKFIGPILALLASGTASTAAMSAAPSTAPCRVVYGEKLPAEAGRAASLCSAVEHAIAAKAPKVRYSAEIRVLSKSALSATLVVNGRTLPEQQFSVSDRNLNPDSIGRFAESLAATVAKAGNPA